MTLSYSTQMQKFLKIKITLKFLKMKRKGCRYMIENFSWLSVNQQIEGALRVQGSVLRKDIAVVSYFSHTVPRTKGKCYGLPG